MTKKNYIAIAKVFKTAITEAANLETREQEDVSAQRVIIETAEQIGTALALVFEQENPRFDRQRFLEAAEIRIN